MLTISDIDKRFGPVQPLDGCSFSVERGSMLGFLGPNGAGKTTTMRAVLGLVDLDGGEVLWDGRAVGLDERLPAPPAAGARRCTGVNRPCISS